MPAETGLPVVVSCLNKSAVNVPIPLSEGLADALTGGVGSHTSPTCKRALTESTFSLAAPSPEPDHLVLLKLPNCHKVRPSRARAQSYTTWFHDVSGG